MRNAWIAIPLLLGCDSRVPSDRPTAVSAASSLREALTEIASRWNRPVRLQFEATSRLARQIREGARADVFIAAAPEWLDAVRPLERFDWLSNRLVLVVRREVERVEIGTLESLALANEQVPAGKYAKAALAHLGVPLPARAVYGSNVRDVLAKVSQGGASAGIVYATDAAIDPEVRIAYTFAPESHPKIVYTAVLLRPEGRAFFDTLRQSWAMEIARRRGFVEAR